MAEPVQATQPVAIVTGGATGVGAATAKRLAERGFRVAILFSRSRDEAEATVADLGAIGAEVVSIRCDVADDADCRRAAADVAGRWARIDVLVNSAGATQFVSMADLDALDAADFQRVFAVNAIGPWQMARAVAPHMRGGAGGSIVNVSSVGALNGNGSSYAYIASKAALNALTLALARNLAPSIRVNAVLPGLVETRWLKQGLGEEAYARVRDTWADAAALQTVCQASDVADAIVWLAVDGALVTGQLLTVDGGFLLGRPARVSR